MVAWCVMCVACSLPSVPAPRCESSKHEMASVLTGRETAGLFCVRVLVIFTRSLSCQCPPAVFFVCHIASLSELLVPGTSWLPAAAAAAFHNTVRRQYPFRVYHLKGRRCICSETRRGCSARAFVFCLCSSEMILLFCAEGC